MISTDERARILDAAEAAPATSWLEAAETLLTQQEARHREKLDGSMLERGEARKRILAVEQLRAVLGSDKSLAKKAKGIEESTDPLVRRMRRADLLCPRGWREGVRQRLTQAGDASERQYLDHGDDQEIIDAQEIRAFIAELDYVATRGERARGEYMRRNMKVA